MEQHFTALQNHYKTWLYTLGFSASTVYNYPKILYYFLEYLKNKGIVRITQLTHQHITDYFNYLQTRQSMRGQKALSKAHLNKSFDCIDKFLEFLHHSGMNNAPQPTHYRIIETKSEALGKIKVLTQKEIQKLYDSTKELFPDFSPKAAEPRQALATLILDLCYGCGLRKSEAFHLLTADIDLNKKILFVRQAKGYKDRYVPLSENINKRIELFMYQYRSTFNVQHKRLFPLSSKESLFYYIKLLRTTSKINKKFGLHTLRHSIATHLLQNGMSIEQIARFLGHSTLESTQVYTHLIHDNTQHP